METNLNANSKTARLSASLFFLVCLPQAIWSEMYVSSKVFVAQDPVATATNLLANEFYFRSAIAGHISANLFFVFMMVLFYRIFRPTDKHLALLMLIPLLAQIPIVFISEVFNYAALMTLKSEARSTFDVAQQQETSYFLLRMYRYTLGPTKFFLGLSFIPFGMLILQSRFAPRVIGILVIISGVGYVADSCCYALMERSSYVMAGPVLRSMFVGFMLALLWFIVIGVRDYSNKPEKKKL